MSGSWQFNDIEEWSCEELQQWVLMLNLGSISADNVNEAIQEQDICGADINSLLSVSDIMDSFPNINKHSARKIYSSLRDIRSNTFDFNMSNYSYRYQNADSEPYTLGQSIYCMDIINKKWYPAKMKQVKRHAVLIQWDIDRWKDPKYDQWIEEVDYDQRLWAKKSKRKSHHIDQWNCDELQQWIIDLNLISDDQHQLIQVISEQEICGTDMNSLQSVTEICDSFPEINEETANNIYNALVRFRPNQEQNELNEDAQNEEKEEKTQIEEIANVMQDEVEDETEMENKENQSNLSIEEPDINGVQESDHDGIDGDNSLNETQENEQKKDEEICETPGQNENEEDDECIVCMDGKKDHIMVPCGHVCICEQCKKIYDEQQDAQCPICRTPIQQVFRAFF